MKKMRAESVGNGLFQRNTDGRFSITMVCGYSFADNFILVVQIGSLFLSRETMKKCL
jgi:hypothetical protein